MASDRSAPVDPLELQRTLQAAQTRPHGRTRRFEASFPAEALPLGAASAGEGLRLGPVLGEGGMGMVHLAIQPGLEREVAVKTLRSGGRRGSSLERFLQEGRVSGLVEHPHVIPVYDLVVTEEGTPALVMKRVTGEPWTQLLADPDLLPRGEADPLAFHLRVLMSLCDALQYAHDIGIVHRDIKPDNVMIGRLGEIYLLDWGLAVSTREEHAGFLALAREATGIAGTPAYMAPEMAVTDAGSIGPATDVYLLGATLHEIVTGAPPHAGAHLYAVALQAYESRPHEYPPAVPAELAGICHRAMAREPADRFASAAELRDALEAFVAHRESHELARAGRAALRTLEQRVADEPEQDAPIQDLFGSVRFSLGQAQQLWPGNEQARGDWERALSCMARWELSRGRSAAAAALLAERSSPDEELKRALRHLKDARQRRDEEVSQLRRLQRDHDLGVARFTRSRLALWLGAIWSVLTAATGRLVAAGYLEFSSLLLLMGGTLLLLMVAALAVVGRGLVANAVNRRIYLCVAAGSIAAVLGRVVGVIHGQSAAFTFAREQVIYALMAAVISIIGDMRILVGAGALLLTAAASTRWPSWALELGGLGVLVTLLCMAYVWRQPR